MAYHLSRPSLLSSENKTQPQEGYRGILNLAVIIIIVTHLRLILENGRKYGVLLEWPHQLVSAGEANWTEWPVTALLLLCNVNILIALGIENFAYSFPRTAPSDFAILVLNVINIAASLLVSASWIFFNSTHSGGNMNPAKGIITLLCTIVCCFKLASYALTNREVRRAHRKKIAPPPEAVGTTVADRPLIQYPANLTASNIYAFMCFPTLVYALNYPRSPRVRKRWLFRRIVEFFSLSIIIVSMCEQWVLPTVRNANVHFDNLDVLMIFERIMKLAIPNIYVWLVGFYVFFHVYLNIVAELSRFGDRLFYRDWWNSRNLDYFWRTWNMPVHNFMKRHVYIPLRAAGWSQTATVGLIFFISAVGHEVILSVPFGTFKLWAFFGMLAQLPLCLLTRSSVTTHSQVGNVTFWISILLGQPLLILFYYRDFTARGIVGAS